MNGRHLLGLSLSFAFGLVVACSSADDPKSQCMDGCARTAKACSGFDRASCESTCQGASTTTTNPQVPEACKSQAAAVQSCMKSAKISCPDGKTPQVTGCESQESALYDCISGS